MIKSVEITNFGKISHISFECGKFNIFDGANDQGKSTVLAAIEWAIIGGNDDSVIRNGEAKCEVILVSTNGTRIERRLSRGGTNKLFVYKDEAPLPEPQKLLNKLFHPKLFDPTSLVTMKSKELNEFVSDAISKRLVLSKEQRALYKIEDLDLDADPVAAISKYYDKLFKERTEINRTVKTLSAKMEGVPTSVDPEEIKALEMDIANLRAKINEGKTHNAKLEASKNNINVKTSTEANIQKLEEELKQINNVDIEILNGIQTEKRKELTKLEQEVSSDRITYKVLKETLEKLSGGIKCPLHDSITCSTDMTPFKKQIEDAIVKSKTDGSAKFNKAETLRKELDEVNKQVETYNNISPKKLELERLKSLVAQLQVFSGELVDVVNLEKDLETKSDKINKLKVALDLSKTSGLDDEKKRQNEYNEKLDLLKELLEVVIPSMLKLNIKDLTLSKEGIFYSGIPFTRLGDSVKLRLSIAILKDLFPKANIYNMDRLERIDQNNLQKYIDVYTKQENDIQYFGAYVGKITFGVPPKVKVFTMENFSIKGV